MVGLVEAFPTVIHMLALYNDNERINDDKKNE
jgi:hypothetical protein